MAESRNTPGSESSGLNLKKFNSTSVTTTTDVITPQLSSADKSRRTLLILAVIVALGAVGAIAFRSSGFNPFEKTAEQPPFTVPEHSAPQ
jgi:hypothetical protein